MPDFEALPLWINIVLFIIMVGVIGVAGTRLVGIADNLAARTGIGEGIVGAVFVGGSTSLAGIVTSMTAAYEGQAEIAVSNAVGGIAGQTAILAVADITYLKANLEHASASAVNLVQAPALVVLLGIPLFAALGPDITVLAVHPATILIVVFYLFTLSVARRQQEQPMWTPRSTEMTVDEKEDQGDARGASTLRLWLTFATLALAIGTAGWVIAQAGVSIAMTTGLSGTVMGGIFTALATSVPELVTTVAAVQRGALNLAVGGIIGGNAFDTLFLAGSDLTFRSGSIYHAITSAQLMLIVLAIIMTAVLVQGLVVREQRGIGGIGWESALILALYVGGFGLILAT